MTKGSPWPRVPLWHHVIWWRVPQPLWHPVTSYDIHGEGLPCSYNILWHHMTSMVKGSAALMTSCHMAKGSPGLLTCHMAKGSLAHMTSYDIHDEGFPSHYDKSHGKGFPWPYDIHGEGFPCPYNILWHPWWRVPLSLWHLWWRVPLSLWHHVTWRRVPLPYDTMSHPQQRVPLPYDIMCHPWQRVPQKGHQTDVIGRPTEFWQFIYARSQEAKFWGKKQGFRLA